MLLLRPQNNVKEPTLGVHWTVLETLYESFKVRTEGSSRFRKTKWVVQNIIKADERLKKRKCSWLKMLHDEKAHSVDGVTKLVAPATTMISHSWDCNFNETANTVIEYAKEKESKDFGNKCYIWMDLFCLNHFDDIVDANWLTEKFQDIIKDVETTVSIMTPFEDPYNLQRVWCLWELYLSIEYNSLEIRLPTNQKQKALESWYKMDDETSEEIKPRYGYCGAGLKLRSNDHPNTVFDKIDAIDVRKAEANNPKHKELIIEHIDSSIGVDELNKKIKDFLRHWFESYQYASKAKSLGLDANASKNEVHCKAAVKDTTDGCATAAIGCGYCLACLAITPVACPVFTVVYAKEAHGHQCTAIVDNICHQPQQMLLRDNNDDLNSVCSDEDHMLNPLDKANIGKILRKNGSGSSDETEDTDDNNSIVDEEAEEMRVAPNVLLFDGSKTGGEVIVLARSMPLDDGVSISMTSIKHFRTIDGSIDGAIELVLYNDNDNVVCRKTIFESSTSNNYRFFKKASKINSKAKRRYYYQVEYVSAGTSSVKIEVDSLVCKIFPVRHRSTHLVMMDGDGEKGRYFGPGKLGGRGAHGDGVLEYENGNTFVGSFAKGKLVEGACYKDGDTLIRTMKGGEWTTSVQKDISLKFPVKARKEI